MVTGTGGVAFTRAESLDNISKDLRNLRAPLSAQDGDNGSDCARAAGIATCKLQNATGTRTSSGEVSVVQAYAYCQRIARQVARTFYYGSLFLPAPKRRAAWAIYAFCRTADDIADRTWHPHDPVAELARWRDALVSTYAGHPRGPIMTAWADMLRTFAVPLEPALELLDGMVMDVSPARFATWDALRLYCYRVAGTVGLLMAPVLGYASAAALPGAVDLGIAMQLTNILRDIGEDAANGRVYLPAEDMNRFGVHVSHLSSRPVTPELRALIEFESVRAEEYYDQGMTGISWLDSDARLAIALSATLYREILDRIRRNGYDVLTCRAHVPFTRKLTAVPGVWLSLRRAGRPAAYPSRSSSAFR